MYPRVLTHPRKKYAEISASWGLQTQMKDVYNSLGVKDFRSRCLGGSGHTPVLEPEKMWTVLKALMAWRHWWLVFVTLGSHWKSRWLNLNPVNGSQVSKPTDLFCCLEYFWLRFWYLEEFRSRTPMEKLDTFCFFGLGKSWKHRTFINLNQPQVCNTLCKNVLWF